MKDPWRFWYEQHNRDVDAERKRKQEPAPPPEPPQNPENPFCSKYRNVTKQFELFAKDPARARRLCEEAGCKWIEPK